MVRVSELALDQGFLRLKGDETLEDAASAFASKGLKALFGRSPEGVECVLTRSDYLKVLAQSWKKKDSLRRALKPIKNDLSPSTSLSQAADVMRRSGQSCLPVMNEGNILGLVTVEMIVDRLLRERAQLKERAKEEQRKRKLREEFLEIAAHDIRSPLAVIHVCCEYLEMMANKGFSLGDEGLEFVNRIKNNCMKASNLVHSLLDLGRIKQFGGLELTRVSLPDYLLASVESARTIAANKNIVVRADIQEPIEVFLDENRFQQILDNLLGNALKFTPSGGAVSIQSTLISGKEDRGAMISIKDSGPGLSKDQQEKMFHRYSQGESEVAASAGFGLGLSIAQQFAALHGAEIVLDSELGKGSTFSIILPGAAVGGRSDDKVTTGVKKIVVVDDDADILGAIVSVLKQDGYRVFSADSGQKGFALFQQFAPDLVITDIKMPQMDGFELLQKIKNVGTDHRVLLTSGYYPNLDKDLAKSVFKADGFVSKPFTNEFLASQVRRLLKTTTGSKH